MKLHQFGMSPNSKRPRVLAHELGLALEVVTLDPMKGENKTPTYLAKNPMGKAPTLEDGNYVLWESPAMLFYLAAKHPEGKLLPSDPKLLAEATRWMFWNASHLENAIFTLAFEKMFKPMMGGQPDPARIESETKDIERFAPVLDAHLEGKEYLAGNYSIADICLATTIEFGAGPVGLDLGRYKGITTWLGRVTSRDTWKKAE